MNKNSPYYLKHSSYTGETEKETRKRLEWKRKKYPKLKNIGLRSKNKVV